MSNFTNNRLKKSALLVVGLAVVVARSATVAFVGLPSGQAAADDSGDTDKTTIVAESTNCGKLTVTNEYDETAYLYIVNESYETWEIELGPGESQTLEVGAGTTYVEAQRDGDAEAVSLRVNGESGSTNVEIEPCEDETGSDDTDETSTTPAAETTPTTTPSNETTTTTTDSNSLFIVS